MSSGSSSEEEDDVSTPPRQPPTRLQFSDGESVTVEACDDDDDDDDDAAVEVSVRALKQQIMGRNVGDTTTPSRMGHDDEDEVTSSLRDELTCVICRELLLDPVSIPCGHSFCQSCLGWWLRSSTATDENNNDASSSKNCPTCRWTITSMDVPSVNTALRACTLKLFATEMKERLRKVTAGENGGAHTNGYMVITELQDDSWKQWDGIRLRRSIVMDSQDQRMQLALALDGHAVMGENGMTIRICLISMEEDEAEDSGVPSVITNEDDEQLICSKDDRFRIAFDSIEVSSQQGQGSAFSERKERTSFGIDGSAVYKCSTKKKGTKIHICHKETGLQLVIDINGGTAQEIDRKDAMRTMGVFMGQDDEEEDEEEGQFDDNDDGFIVDDDEEEVPGEEENDTCCICGDVGELIVCDGGDNAIEGCNQAFHLKCIGREEVPDGDWICSKCAKSGGLSVAGNGGHEYQVGKDETDSEFGNSPVAKSKQKIIDESDEDEVAEKSNKREVAAIESSEEAESAARPSDRKRRAIFDSDSE